MRRVAGPRMNFDRNGTEAAEEREACNADRDRHADEELQADDKATKNGECTGHSDLLAQRRTNGSMIVTVRIWPDLYQSRGEETQNLRCNLAHGVHTKVTACTVISDFFGWTTSSCSGILSGDRSV